MPKKPATLQYILFALVAAAALVFSALNSVSQYQYLWHGHERASAPVSIGESNRVEYISREALKAGVHKGDRLLEINSQPVRSNTTLGQVANDGRPGDPVQLLIERKDGSRAVLACPLPPAVHDGALKTSFRFFILFLQVVFPALCLLIGLWVIAAKPRDPNAWYVFCILGFIQCLFSSTGFWLGAPRAFMAVYNDLAFQAFNLGMLLFGIYFPERSLLDIRFPWGKWFLIILTLIFSALDVFSQIGRSVDLGISAWIPEWLHKLDDRTENVIAVICICLFFALLFPKYFTASTGDAKRRLGVLVWGAEIGLTPLFINVVIAQIRGKTNIQEAVPAWFFWCAIVLFFVFPLTLAYVIVVERAMDVRILLRQGTQYALARGTLNIIRVILVVLLGFTIYLAVSKNSEIAWGWTAILGLLFLTMQFGGNQRLSAWLDRRFFREAYSTEQVLIELSEEAGRFTETRPLLDTVTRRIGDTLHVSRIGVLLQCSAGFCLDQAAGLPDNGVSLQSSSLTIKKLRTEKRPLTVYYDNPDGWLMLASEKEQEMLKRLSAEVLLPLPGRRDLVGVIALGPKRSEAPYSRSDLSLLRSVAAQTGLAIENSRLFSSLAAEAVVRERANREMEIAREVQRRLFPQTAPFIRGVDLAGHCRPALGIGGDYYDFIALDRASNGSAPATSRLGIAIGDVSGKGISAALLMASLRASLRGQTLTGFDLAHLVRNVNLLLYDSSDSNRYATFFFAEYDPTTRQLTYVNAGHNAPVVLRPQPEDGTYQILRLEEGGPVVGLIQEVSYQQSSIVMEPGDVLLGYTDGISEAMDPQDEEWGEDRMIAKALSCPHLSAQQILDCIFEAADTFALGAPQHDDMTLVLMKVGQV